MTSVKASVSSPEPSETVRSTGIGLTKSSEFMVTIGCHEDSSDISQYQDYVSISLTT